MSKFNFKKYIFIILSIVLVVIILNFITYVILIKHAKTTFMNNINQRKNFSITEFIEKTEFNDVKGQNYDKPGIILFGCGVAQGYSLPEGQLIEDKLANLLHRPIYNRSVGGAGIQHAILQVQSGEIDDIIKNSDNAIFIQPALNDNIRLHTFPGPLNDPHYIFDKYMYPTLKLKDNKLILNETIIPQIKGSVLYRILNKAISTALYTTKNSSNLHKSNERFVLKHFIELNSSLKAINPDIKLSVIIYWNDHNVWSDILNELIDNGIQFIFIPELTDEDLYENTKYKDLENSNPTSEAWDLILPLIIDKLGLK